jgi:hypothetical protein
VLMSRTLRCLTLNTTTPGCRAEGSTSRNGLRLTSPVRGQRLFQIVAVLGHFATFGQQIAALLWL